MLLFVDFCCLFKVNDSFWINMSSSRLAIDTQTNIGLKLQKQSNDEEFSDITLQVEDETFNAHRSVLAAVSDYFRKMFTIDMKEKNNRVILIKTVTARAFKEILDSIYTNRIVLSEDNLTEILHAASMMQIKHVLNAATTYMQNRVSVSNCYFFKDLATLYSFEELLKIIHQFILRNTVEISNGDQFLELSLNDIEELLKSDDLTVDDEYEAFNILVKWINKDLEQRQQHFPQLFKHVRLQFIPIKQVVEEIATNELVRRFHECRNLIEEAFSFHMNPSAKTCQKYRKCFASQPESLLCLSSQKQKQKSYNLATKQWVYLSFGIPKIIRQDCAVATNHPITVVCGGIDSSDQFHSSSVSNQVMKFTGTHWMTLPSLNVARCGAAAVFQESQLYVFGGETIPISKDKTFKGSNANPSVFDFAKSFETLYGFWEQTDNDWQVRSYFSAQAINEKIYLIGGYKPTISDASRYSSHLCKTVCKDVVIYFPNENTWDTDEQLNVARASFGCAVHQSSIYVVGGYGEDNSLVYSVEFKNQYDVAWTLCPLSIVNGGPMSACFVRNRMYIASKSSSCEIIVLDLQKSDVKENDDLELNSKKFLGDIVPFSEKFFHSGFYSNPKCYVVKDTTYCTPY